MRRLLILMLVVLLGFTVAVQAAPEADAYAIINLKSVNDLTIVVEVEICGDCRGLVSWDDGSVGYDIDLGSGGNPLEFDHTYTEAGCYAPSVYAHSLMDDSETNVPLNPPVAVGDPTACDSVEPSGTLTLKGVGTIDYSALFNVDWEGGQATVEFSDEPSWKGDTTSGNQDVQHEYGDPGGVFRVSLRVGGVAQNHMCIGVSSGAVMEVSCDQPPPVVWNIYIPLLFRAETEEPPSTCGAKPVANGSFEAKCFWETFGAYYSTIRAYIGEWSMYSGLLTGDTNRPKYGEWRGQVYVPPSGSPELQLYYSLERQEEAVSLGHPDVDIEPTRSELFDFLSLDNTQVSPNVDTVYCYIFDSSYSRVLERFLWKEVKDDKAWSMAKVNLTPYKDMMVGVWCGLFNNGEDMLSSAFFDSVQVVTIE